MVTGTENHSPHRRNYAVMTLGWICVLLGLAILAGGVWLILLGGSWYYAPAGLGLMLTGLMLNWHRMDAVWIYVLTWLGTAIWAYWEVGTDWWAQLPRMLAPTLILILVLICIPALRRR
ncbi:glucose dehydrogenase [Pseudooceanicola sp.]|uniref:glucose dehydrogenase n=1 Tax=Pseudooceanicola sp. TaxID=1914328 RepID=UPI003518AFBD